MPFKDKLEDRATKQEWFELQQAQEAYADAFEEEKIVYSRFLKEHAFAMSPKGAFINNALFCLPQDYSLLALLNSKPTWFHLMSTGTDLSGGFSQADADDINDLPIPLMDSAQNARLAELAFNACKASQTKLKIQTALTRRIPDLCPPERAPKLTTRLQEWWTLPDFAAFRAEVKRAYKADIPLADRSDWEDWINRDRVEIARLTAEIAQAEAQINSIVYDLFELNEDEIALLESTT